PAPPPPPEGHPPPPPTHPPAPGPGAPPAGVVSHTPQTVPEEATTEIVTEAEAPAPAAPESSTRPRARPPRPSRVAETPVPPTPEPPQPEPAAEQAPEPDAPQTPPQVSEATSDAVADALAEALSGSQATAPSADIPRGPPMTQGERDALRVAVQQCWNVGSLSSEALRTTVVVSVEMSQDGRPDSGSIRMVSSSGGGEAAKQAFEAARRAIIRCGANGYDLPAEKYAQWRNVEITFDPDRMRLR
ncbi:MAG: hypothetical protein ACU0AT_04735, partial [Tranquillimonas sp.]